MRTELPLEVLGKISPILSQVEGVSSLSWPSAWLEDVVPDDRREQAWLIGELPTYSFDTVDVVVKLARSDSRAKKTLWPTRPRLYDLSPPAGYDLAKVFDGLAQRYFVWNGGTVVVREGRMEELHDLSLRFPVGHLIRHLHGRAVGQGWMEEQDILALPEQVSLLPSNAYPLRTIVRSGLTEGHIHLKGVSSVEDNWADQLLQTFGSDTLQGFDANEKRLLLLSRYAGRVLALAVLYCKLDDQSSSLPFHLLEGLDALYFARDHREERVVRGALRDDLDRVLSPGFSRGGTVGRAGGRRGQVPLVAEAWGQDPEFAWLLHWIHRPTLQLRRSLYHGGGSMLHEMRFPGVRGALLERLHFEAHRHLARLPASTAQRYFLHQALYRYLIFRTHHWQLGTQRGKTTGLRQFKRFYDSRQRRYIGVEEGEVKRQILARLRRWRGLRVLEGRISPPENAKAELRPWILGYAEGAKQGRLKKFGLIVHFIKAESQEFELRATEHGYPSLRYAKIRRTTRHEAFRLFRTLSSPDPWVPFIVGIDAANLELTTPPEVYAPAFRFLRDLPIEIREPVDPNSPQRQILVQLRRLVERRRLGMTYHVGEDFRHILSGLRAIHEVMLYLQSHPGDRLGHAIALGLDPEVWLEQTGYQAVLPRIEWLDTLVWLHHLLGPGNETVGRLGIEDDIQRLAWKIYAPRDATKMETQLEGKDLSPLTLYDAWMLRQLDPYSLDIDQLGHGDLRFRDDMTAGMERRRWAFIQKQTYRKLELEIGAPNSFRLLRSYWFSHQVRKNGDEPILVEMGDEKKSLWVDLCNEVQERMIDELGRRQMVVEVNPTVNRMIGPMERLDQHHVFRLTLDRERRLQRRVRVTVNTDNPAVFNTSLAHEYYLLGETLLGEGRPEGEVVEWLEWLRQNGEQYSFVRQLPAADDPEMAAVLESILETRPTVRSVAGKRRKLEEFWKQWNRATEGREPSPQSLAVRLARLERELGLTSSGRTAVERVGQLESELGTGRNSGATLGSRVDRLEDAVPR